MMSTIAPIVLTDDSILPDSFVPSSSSKKENDSVDLTAPTADDYIETIKDRVFRWLAERCIKQGKAEFKLSDVKASFETIAPVYLEAVAAALVEEGKIFEPEGRSRIVIYTVDANHAFLALPPEPVPDLAEEVTKKPPAPKKRPLDGKENNDTSSSSSSSSGPAKHAKASASSSSSSSGTRPVSPFRDVADESLLFGRLDGGADSGDDADAAAISGDGGGATAFKASPPVSFRLGAEAAGTFLAPALRDAMTSVLCDAFADSGAGVVTRRELNQLMQAHALALVDGDVDEFLRYMSDQNKAMVEGDDIYEI